MKKSILIMTLILLFPSSVYAARGCCSSHGGVAGCSNNGRQVCNDGTLSPSCTCTPPRVYGCTDKKAKNYNNEANTDDGNCKYYIMGCTDANSINYNQAAEKDDGSCIKKNMGCTNPTAYNYDKNANTDDNSCIDKIYGCTDKKAENYNINANTDDGTCKGIVNSNTNDETKNDGTGGTSLGILTSVAIIGTAVYIKRKKK